MLNVLFRCFPEEKIKNVQWRFRNNCGWELNGQSFSAQFFHISGI